MCQSMEPISREEYERLFGVRADAIPGNTVLPIAYKALETALDVRKFEIDLYWKRAAYFWAFIAASLVGYTTTVDLKYGGTLPVIFANLGLAFSFAWLCMNRGSKFWQGNWEKHVDLLEDGIQGPLYKVIAFERPPKDHLLSRTAFPFSVSKINQIVSNYVFVLWVVLLIRSILVLYIDLFPRCLRGLASVHLVAIVATLGGASFPFVVRRLGRSSFSESLEGKDVGWHLGKRRVDITPPTPPPPEDTPPANPD